MTKRFQDRVLREIAGQEPVSRRAALSQLAAIVQCCGSVCKDGPDEYRLKLVFTRREAMEKCFTLLLKTFNITTVSAGGDSHVENSAGQTACVHCQYELSGEPARQIAAALFLLYADGKERCQREAVTERLLPDRKCIRSFLAGQFLCIGSVRDPGKEYYLSYDVLSDSQAGQTKRLLASEKLTLRQVQHGRSRALLTRDSDVIVDVLNLLGAHGSMMEMENARIVKQVRGGVNRQVNCETANIIKTVNASQKQIEEIRRLRNSGMWETLPQSLREVADLREQYPECSLQELGQKLDPPVGKSGVNHRLRRISAAAQQVSDV